MAAKGQPRGHWPGKELRWVGQGREPRARGKGHPKGRGVGKGKNKGKYGKGKTGALGGAYMVRL